MHLLSSAPELRLNYSPTLGVPVTHCRRFSPTFYPRRHGELLALATLNGIENIDPGRGAATGARDVEWRFQGQMSKTVSLCIPALKRHETSLRTGTL
jgi:hypothetical protein